jgi:plastocyanin
MKKGTIIGIIVVVIVVVIAGVYLGTQNNNNNSGSNNGGNNGGTTPVVENPVTISAFAFNPHVMTIHAGENVTWKNNDGVTHTVTSDDNSSVSFNSGMLGDGSTFVFRFSQPGDYWYHCSIHSFMTHALVRVVTGTA